MNNLKRKILTSIIKKNWESIFLLIGENPNQFKNCKECGICKAHDKNKPIICDTCKVFFNKNKQNILDYNKKIRREFLLEIFGSD